MSHANSQARQHDAQCESVVVEYFDRLDRGEVIDRESFLAAHADLADELAEFLDAADLIERLAGPTADESPTSPAHDTAPTPTHFETLVGGPGANSLRQNAAPEGISLPRQFGRYLVLKQLGQGAMGSVYLANDTELDRHVALKIPRFLASDGADVVERFYREARASATIRHPNVCPVFDVGKIDGCLFISMAYIEGEPLSSLPAAPPERRQEIAARIVAKLARALHEAHSRGVVHRDLKPANIMLDRQGEPIVTDFGLARRIGGEEGRLTQSGVMVGSPAYMSPEQISGNPAQIGPLSDIYSLGIILYELLAGKLPYEGSLFSIIGQIALSEPRPIAKRCEGLAVDGRLEAICLKMMARRPEDRYSDMGLVATDLEEFLEVRTTPSAKHGIASRPKATVARPPRRAPKKAVVEPSERASGAHFATAWLTRRNLQIGGVTPAGLLLALLAWLNPLGLLNKSGASASQAEAAAGDKQDDSTPDKSEKSDPESKLPIHPPVAPGQAGVEISTIRTTGFHGTPLGVGHLQLKFAPGLGPRMLADQALLIADAKGRVHYPVFAPEWEEAIVDVDATTPEIAASASPVPPDKRRLKQISAYFLFSGERPLELTLALDDIVLRKGEKLEPLAAGSQGQELVRTWWNLYTAHRPASREAWEVKAYLNDMLARRLSLFPEIPPDAEERADVSQIERHFERAVQTFFGLDSVERAIQDTTLLKSRDEDVATEPLPQPLRTQPVPIPPFAPAPIESLAMRVPAECFYLRCQSLDNYLWFRSMLLKWGGSTTEIVSPRTRDTQTRERIETQLALRPDAAAQAALHGALRDLAIIGSDPFFEDGAGVGVLFEARDKEKLLRWLTKMRTESLQSNARVSEQTVQVGSQMVKLLSSSDQTVRSYLAVDGDYVLVTNSSHLAARFFEVKSGNQCLGELQEFRYARGKVRVFDEQSAFLYLSDPFFRRMASPQYRIELTRRMRAKAELRGLALAQLAARGEGAPSDNVDALLAQKFLPAKFGTRCDGSRAALIDGRPTDSLRGLPGTFTPICDITVERATRSEVTAFLEFGSNYGREWRAVDPVTVVLSHRPHDNKAWETVAMDITVTPYARQRYARLAARLAPSTKERVTLQAGDLLSVDVVLRGISGINILAYAGVRDAKVSFKMEDGQTKLDESFNGSFALNHSFFAMTPGGSESQEAVQEVLDAMGVRLGNLGSLAAMLGKAPPISELPRWILSLFFPSSSFQAPPSTPTTPRTVPGWNIFALQTSIREGVRTKLSQGAAAESSQLRLKLSDVSGTLVEPYVQAYTFLQERRASARTAQFFDYAAQQFHLSANNTPATLEQVFGARQVCPLQGTYRARQVEGVGAFWRSTHWPQRSLHLENAVPAGYQYPFLAWLHGLRLRFTLDQNTLAAQVEFDVAGDAGLLAVRSASPLRNSPSDASSQSDKQITIVHRPAPEPKVPDSKTPVLEVADADSSPDVPPASTPDSPPKSPPEPPAIAAQPTIVDVPTTDGVPILDLFAPGVLGVRMESDTSVVVKAIYRTGAAEQAGFEAGDELWSVNGRRVQSLDELRQALRAASQAEISRVSILRDGQQVELKVRLGGHNAKKK